MGITGLLPFLKSASREVNIRDFKGCTVAIDSYCWLHKGAFACADKLALGEKTDQYVYYCMKYVNSLLAMGLKPIMVFDGCRLPSKENVEKERRQRRDLNRKKAAQLLREGKRAEARECLQRCVDITPQMALHLMNACRAKGVDCIVAPYEADAQLAYLNQAGIAQIIITEDSDLILFGCEKVIFKMDFAGNGVLVERSQLNKAMDLKADMYTFEKFRYMCILSGCDYLASLPGIGLKKACKLFKLTRQPDMTVLLKKLPTILKMSNLEVSSDYVKGFHKANNTFLYQLTYDPLGRKQVPLTPYSSDIDPRELEYAGSYMSQERALQVSLGNIDINTGKTIAHFNPDTFKAKTQNWNHIGAHMLSIWDLQYRPMRELSSDVNGTDDRPSTKGKQVIVKVNTMKRTPVPPMKRSREEIEAEEARLHDELAVTYTDTSPTSTPAAKRPKCEWDEEIHSTESTQSLNPPRIPEYLQSCRSDIKEPSPQSDEMREEFTSGLPVSPGQSKENIPSPQKSPRKTPSKNRFALHGNLKKNRFNLNAGRSEGRKVQSRFFAASKPLPKTNFFHQLAEHLPENPKPEPVSDVMSEPTNPDSTEPENSPEETSFGLTEEDYKTTICPKVESATGSSSPYGSFGFQNKLSKFKSTFAKAGVTLPKLKCTPKSKSQFKPVTITKAFEKSSQINHALKSEKYSQNSELRDEEKIQSQSEGASQESNLCSIDQESFSWSPPSSSLSQSFSQASAEPDRSSPLLPSLPSDFSTTSQTLPKSSSLTSFLKAGKTNSSCSIEESTEQSHCERETIDRRDVSHTFSSSRHEATEVKYQGIKLMTTPSVKARGSGGCRGSGLTKSSARSAKKATSNNSDGQAQISSFFSKYFFQKRSSGKLQHNIEGKEESCERAESTPQGALLHSRLDSTRVQRKLELTSHEEIT